MITAVLTAPAGPLTPGSVAAASLSSLALCLLATALLQRTAQAAWQGLYLLALAAWAIALDHPEPGVRMLTGPWLILALAELLRSTHALTADRSRLARAGAAVLAASLTGVLLCLGEGLEQSLALANALLALLTARQQPGPGGGVRSLAWWAWLPGSNCAVSRPRRTTTRADRLWIRPRRCGAFAWTSPPSACWPACPATAIDPASCARSPAAPPLWSSRSAGWRTRSGRVRTRCARPGKSLICLPCCAAASNPCGAGGRRPCSTPRWTHGCPAAGAGMPGGWRNCWASWWAAAWPSPSLPPWPWPSGMVGCWRVIPPCCGGWRSTRWPGRASSPPNFGAGLIGWGDSADCGGRGDGGSGCACPCSQPRFSPWSPLPPCPGANGYCWCMPTEAIARRWPEFCDTRTAWSTKRPMGRRRWPCSPPVAPAITATNGC